ncbi:MAG: hypothetical protein L0Y54_20700 [Sporichthyaceae bacterium]|nr:hypothetical protein [Sporichthyaceae bacterium]
MGALARRSTALTGTIVVQGYTLSGEEKAQMDLPDGESAVETPTALISEVFGVGCV